MEPPMHRTAMAEAETTGAFLLRRLRLTALLVLVPLACATAISISLLSASRLNEKYAVVFADLEQAAYALELQIGQAVMFPRERHIEINDARQSFVRLLRAYTALRAADHDDDVRAGEGTQSPGARLDDLAASFGLDRNEARLAYDLEPREMPARLVGLWEARRWDHLGARASLESSMGLLLLSVAPAFQPNTGYPPNLDAIKATLHEFNKAGMNVLLQALRYRLEERENKNAMVPVYLVLAISALVLGSIIIVASTVLAPAIGCIKASHRDLVLAREAAQQSERAKAEFLASMSHEIRTPLNGVIGMTELLADTGLGERQKMFVDIIGSSAGALLAIINDILDFSKIDAGQIAISPEPFKLSRLAAEPAQILAERAAAKNLEMSVRVAPEAPRVLVGDFGRLRQVVTNLLGNAVKFTQAGEVALDLSTEPAPDDPDSVVLILEVRDTGIGIPEEQLPRIFERFTQVDGSSTRAHGGTGLGLAISKGLVEAMGGRLEAHSVPGVGSTFRVRIPLPVSVGERPAAMPSEVEGRRVLVIDDNETNRFILGEQLHAWRFEGAAAVSGSEGICELVEAAQSGGPFDLVLLDHHMPGMNGEDVLRAIRSTEGIADTPVILLTSIVDGASVAACRSLGLEGYLVKPTLSSPLLDRIAEVLSGRVPAGTPPCEGLEPIEASGVPDVMIVEDNNVNRMLAEQIVRRMGYTHVSAEDGLEALDVFAATRPRLILMDVSMPRLDGYKATARIREMEAASGAPRTPIIGLTAHALEGARNRCLEAGMDDYLSKPIPTDALKRLVKIWLAAVPEMPDAVRERASSSVAETAA